MTTPIAAQLEYGGSWMSAELSNEHGDTPVVLVAGENMPRGVDDVLYLWSSARTDRGLLHAARKAGFHILEC
jgi:hypothetical protein